MSKRKEGLTVLWVDDDGPERFMYEQFVLERQGWRIRWALNMLEAANYLKDMLFPVVIMDQMFPIQDDEPSAWGGYLLLAWMRGEKEIDPAAPCLPAEICRSEPLEGNRAAVVIIASAFFDKATSDALACLPHQAKTMVIPKPIHTDSLMRAIEGLR